MKRLLSLTIFTLLLSAINTSNAFADRGGHGHGGGGWGGGHHKGGGWSHHGGGWGHGGRDWHRGSWNHTWHNGRYGAWWVVGNIWNWYPAAVYPYPVERYEPSVTYQIVQPPAPQVVVQPPSQMWYYCDRPAGYYPYVPECPTGWRSVPANPR